MPFKPNQIEKALLNKFEFAPSLHKATDHRWYELRRPGRKTILTKLSHSGKDVGKELEPKIARQLEVTTPFFREMIRCTKSKEDYYAIIDL